METKTINLRDLPEEFVRKAKAYAALSGVTLKDFVMKAVENAMQEDIRPMAANSAFAQGRRKKKQ